MCVCVFNVLMLFCHSISQHVLKEHMQGNTETHVEAVRKETLSARTVNGYDHCKSRDL